jgi:hypothetical protein
MKRNDYPLTVKGLREALEGLADDGVVRVAVLTVKDAYRLKQYADTHEGVANIRLPSAMPAVVAHQTAEGGLVILTVRPHRGGINMEK